MADRVKAFCSLPEHIDERKICNAVTPDKDVDGFHVINVGRMCLDQYSMLPATPWGVWEIIKRTGKLLLQYLAAVWHNSSLCLFLRLPSCPLQASQRWGRTWWWLAGQRTWACPSPCCCIRTAGTSAREVGAWWPRSLRARQLQKETLCLSRCPLQAPKPVPGVP